MPPKKRPRSTSSLLGDRHPDDNQPTPQDEDFQVLHDPEPLQPSADNVDVDVGIAASSESEAVDGHTSAGSEDLASYNDSEHEAGGGSSLEHNFFAEDDDIPMIDEPTSDGSTPWLDYLHHNDNPYSPVLPFGLQLAHTASLSTNGTYDNTTSDEEGGGVSLNDQSSADDIHQADWSVQHLDLNFSPPGQYATFEDPGETVQLPPDPNPSVALGANAYPPALPFGIMAPTTTETYTPNVPGFNDILTPHLATPPPPPGLEGLPPLMPSSTNYMILGSENVGLIDFLRRWAHMEPPMNPVPNIHQIHLQSRRAFDEVTYNDLSGDFCDIQGMNWVAMEIPRTAARTHRRKVYKNYVNMKDSDKWTKDRPETWVNNSEDYFRFRKTILRSDVNLSHFQLRSVLATPSRVQAFYPTSKGVYRLNPLTKKTELAIDLGEFSALNRTITTLDAACDVLVAGTFGGDYIIKSTHAQSVKKQSEGSITNPQAGITNHLQVHTQRGSNSPVAAISSNDKGFRVLDVQTEEFISDFMYHFPLNCSAVSPDRRLRVLVGDSRDVAITNVETGETEVELSGHKDYGFSCDWSDDGFTVATGFQDKSVKIWDARKWTNINRNPTPVSVWCDMAGVRNLKFSPLGSGPEVLVSAEEADYINIFDAKRGDPNALDDRGHPQAFQRKQTIDLFGEIGGISFADEGHELNVLVSDPHRGGLLQFERATLGSHKPTRTEHVPIF